MRCSLLVLSSHLDGELESRRQGELEAHLVGCQRCRAGLGYLQEEVDRISSLGRVHVTEHSAHALLHQLGLVDEDDAFDLEPHGATATATATAVAEPDWFGRDSAYPHDHDLDRVDDRAGPQHGQPERGWPAPPLPPPLPPAMPPLPTPADFARDAASALDHAPLAAAAHPTTPPSFTWRPTLPASGHQGVPAVPFEAEAAQRPVPPAALPGPEPPRDAFRPPGDGPPGPTAAEPASDHAPSAPSGGAFPPGGPGASDLPPHVTAPGDPEMTASPPWTPHDAPPTPLYPLTDEDVLEQPVPVERFGPPQQAPRPSFFERLRDRFATRRALARSSSAFDDSVQIVSGTGAPLRLGRARLEVERRRQEALRMDPGTVPGGLPPAHDAEADDELSGLGPLPPLATPLRDMATRMPRPGTQVPPPRHTLGSALGEVPAPPRMPLPPSAPAPRASLPSAAPPRTPMPDPLGEALSSLDRDHAVPVESRPWRPRELPAEMVGGMATHSVAGRPAETAPQRGPSPSELRDGRRLLGLFGAATLVMLIVGIASGRTTSPLPASTGAPSARSSTPAAPAPTHPAARASSAPSQITLGPPAQQQQQAPAAGAQLTGLKVLGDSGSGYQVKGFRYGIHPNDFRIVLDLDASGSASGTPKATLGFLDSTTLLIALDGVVPAGSTGQLPSSNPVVSVTLLQQSPIPGATTYQVKLAHPVTFSAVYATSPLRLVIDIAG